MQRYQYRIVNLGAIKAADRMVAAFGNLGMNGWKLVAMYDKSSNWFAGLEKGFAIFMKEVDPEDQPDGEWASWEYAFNVGSTSDDGFHAW